MANRPARRDNSLEPEIQRLREVRLKWSMQMDQIDALLDRLEALQQQQARKGDQ